MKSEQIEFKKLDPDALQIIETLQLNGHEAYFVGGCVRDLLLGLTPKDFDLATSATPREVRRLFRNCRLIGRRFQLAHLLYGSDKIIEVATFRRAPSKELQRGKLIVDDNNFGDVTSDSFRRDFTVNALFYDPIEDRIVDRCRGKQDLSKRLLRTIGEPRERFQEDPIRMLRGIKFAARLDLSFEKETEAALRSERSELSKAAKPRFLQELLRMMQGGAAARSYELLEGFAFLELLCPELLATWEARPATRAMSQGLLQRLDLLPPERRAELSDPTMVAILFWPTFQELSRSYNFSYQSRERFAQRLLAPFATRVSFPAKDLLFCAQLLAAQDCSEAAPLPASNRLVARQSAALALLRGASPIPLGLGAAKGKRRRRRRR